MTAALGERAAWAPALETDQDAAIVQSLVLLAVSILVLASPRDRWITGGVTP